MNNSTVSLRRFGTIEGVFVPTLLSILGVIMYLRLGWVVGEVGLRGALEIIVMANLITLATALSMSSVVTNIRIGAGGAHSIIAKSLGVEAGGAIGIPLYLSQAISIAFYITGFSECWTFVFPGHSALLVSLVTWLGVLLVSYWSAKAAFRLQYVIMGVIALSLVSVFFGHSAPDVAGPVLRGAETESFWKVFAIFFPAVTGVLAGAAMSGELKDPRASIPKGTLAAVAVSFVLYVFLADWFAFHSDAAHLVGNRQIIIAMGRWRMLVVAGIMGATLSSALAMQVGSPRTLFALGRHRIVPFASVFARVNARGEPTPAVLLTALIVLVTILTGSLDSVARLLTMFFLITYGVINFSVFIEQSMGIVSFRPTFSIPRLVPFFGALGCLAVMLIIDVKFSLIAFVCIGVIYFILLRRQVEVHSPDVRNGLLMFVAELFAKSAARLPYHPKIWKPNLLVPVRDVRVMETVLPFIQTIASPTGRLIFYSVVASRREAVAEALDRITAPLKEEKFFVESAVVESSDFSAGSAAVVQTVSGMAFPPNTFFYVLGEAPEPPGEVEGVVATAAQEGLGVILMKLNPQGFMQQRTANVWIRRQTPNIDLSILIALQIRDNWDGEVRLIQIAPRPEEVNASRDYLKRLKQLMRLPSEMPMEVLVGDFARVLSEAPPADVNIFGMPQEPDLAMIWDVYRKVGTSVMFLRDSKHESAMA